MEIDRLDKIQDFFWQVMLRVPESCPRIALQAEMRMMGMKHRIWLEKTMLLKRIKRQKTDSLSKKILEEQKSNKWPGLSQEVTNICEEINIPDINDCEISAREIKQAMFDHHYGEIKSKIPSSKKMMSQKDENRSPRQHERKVGQEHLC